MTPSDVPRACGNVPTMPVILTACLRRCLNAASRFGARDAGLASFRIYAAAIEVSRAEHVVNDRSGHSPSAARGITVCRGLRAIPLACGAALGEQLINVSHRRLLMREADCGNDQQRLRACMAGECHCVEQSELPLEPPTCPPLRNAGKCLCARR